MGQKVITRNCTGYLPSQVAFYLQNIHILPRRIYLSLNSEVDPITSRLTEAGLSYSLELAKYIYARQETVTDLSKDVFVLAGTTDVHAETILHLRNIFPCYHTTLLNEIRAGDAPRSSEVGRLIGRLSGFSQIVDCLTTAVPQYFMSSLYSFAVVAIEGWPWWWGDGWPV